LYLLSLPDFQEFSDGLISLAGQLSSVHEHITDQTTLHYLAVALKILGDGNSKQLTEAVLGLENLSDAIDDAPSMTRGNVPHIVEEIIERDSERLFSFYVEEEPT